MTSKVFGIGFGKTGTKTLKACFRQLGYNHTGCSEQLTRSLKLGDWPLIFQVADRHDAFEDFPWPLMYKEMDARYPNSKFILTVRESSEVWFQSLLKHANRTGPTQHRKLAYGQEMPHGFKQENIAFYERHIQEVRQYFEGREQDLLEVCWETGDGWQELCNFLGHDVPDVEFPWRNKAPSLFTSFKKGTKQNLKKLLAPKVGTLQTNSDLL